MNTTDQLFIERLLSKTVDLGATDVHLSAGNPPMIRVDGKLAPMEGEAIVTPELLQLLKEAWVLNELQPRLQKDREVIFSKRFKDHLRFRVHILYQQGFPSFSLRYLSDKIFSIRDLNLPDQVSKFSSFREGMILVGGSYGSGRTTTLVSLVQAINVAQSSKIVTLEDPVEVLIPDQNSMIDQREVGRDVLSISAGLDRVLGEDLDVVVISELIQPPEVKKALLVADSGRLVIATINCTSFLHLIEKIVHQFIGEEREWVRELLSRTLQGAIVQKLIPKQGGGRVMGVEVVIPNDVIRSLIRDGNLFQLTNIIQHSRGEGIISLDHSLAKLVSAGVISTEEAQRYAVDKDVLAARLNVSMDQFQ